MTINKEYSMDIDLLNKKNVGLDKDIFFNKNDNRTSIIYATIYNGDKPLLLEECDIFVSVKKPNGNNVIDKCEVLDAKKGIIKIEFTRDMLNFAGLATFQISVQYDMDMVVSNSFHFCITKPVVEDEDILDSDNYPVLLELQEEANSSLKSTEILTDRVEHLEIKLTNNEKERNNSEIIRISNENERIDNENTRKSNESERKSNEQKRINNENRRNSDFTELNNSYNMTKEKVQEISDTIDKQHKEIDNTHTEILNNEKIRVSNEKNRVEKEEIRQSNEKERVNSHIISKELIAEMTKLTRDNELIKRVDSKADKAEVDKFIQELSDEDINVVAEDKKLSEVLPTVAKKGEILPQDIKGNALKSLVQYISMNENDNIAVEWINSEGLVKKYHIYLSEKYAKKTDLEALQNVIDGIKQEIGGYAKRLENANNEIEAKL